MPRLSLRRSFLADAYSRNEALDLLSRNERELVATILASAVSESCDHAGNDDDRAFLELARLRLRNIVEKHSEALKRARLAARADPAGQPIEAIEKKLRVCREALEICRQRLENSAARD